MQGGLHLNDIKPSSIYFDPFLGFPCETAAAPRHYGMWKIQHVVPRLRDSLIIPADFASPHFVENSIS